MIERIELGFDQVKKLEWSDVVFENLDETIKELEKQKPYFRFYKNYEAEIVYYSKDSENTTCIGKQGVEGKNWESFLEELEELGVIKR